MLTVAVDIRDERPRTDWPSRPTSDMDVGSLLCWNHSLHVSRLVLVVETIFGVSSTERNRPTTTTKGRKSRDKHGLTSATKTPAMSDVADRVQKSLISLMKRETDIFL